MPQSESDLKVDGADYTPFKTKQKLLIGAFALSRSPSAEDKHASQS
jgi:hypothetical protein